MSALQWDQSEQKFYHSGISKVILFPNWNVNLKTYTGGVAWNGVTSIEESPDGGEANDIWADNVKYGSMRAVENLKGSISAYQWPDALNALDGKLVIDGIAILGQQKRTKRFGLCYRTEIGTEGNPNAGYQLHFLYNLMISPSEKSYETITDSPDATEFSWDFECLPQKQQFAPNIGWQSVFPGESIFYSGSEGKKGYHYVYPNQYDGENIITHDTSTYYATKLIPYKDTLYFHYSPSENQMRESLQLRAQVYGTKNGEIVLASDKSVTKMYMSFPDPDNPSHIPPLEEITDALYGDFINGRAGNPEDWPNIEYMGININGVGDELQLVDSEFEILEQLLGDTQTYTYASVTLDSRNISTEKMEAVSQIIYTIHRMPTLSELLG